MNENSTQADRIRVLMRHFELNQSSFSREIDIQQPNLSPVFQGKKELSLGMIKAILKKYNNLNANWLILGAGPMFNDAGSSKKISADNELNEPGDLYQSASDGKMAEVLESLRILLADYNRRIATLEEELRLLRGAD